MDPAEYDSPPWGRNTKTIVSVAALILSVVVIWRFRALISPIVIAIIIAYLLSPIINFVQSQVNLSRGSAVLLVYLLLFIVLALGGFLLGIATWEQGTELYQRFPTLLDRAVNDVQDRADQLFAHVIIIGPVGPYGPYEIDPAGMLDRLDGRVLVNQTYSLLEPFFAQGGSVAAQIAGAALRVFGLIFIIIALSIYIARDMPRFSGQFSDLAHQPGYRRDADRIMKDSGHIWNAYLRGQILLAVVIGVVVSIGLGLLGVHDALALGILSGVFEFLPVAGPVIGAGAAILVAFFQPENYLGLSPLFFAGIVALFMIVVQQLENSLLVPRIVGGALQLHPLVIMVGVLMGASLAGILGAILAAPILATVKLLGTYAWRKLLDLPPFPDSNAYFAPSGAAPPRGLDRLHGWLTRYEEEDSDDNNDSQDEPDEKGKE